MEQDDATTNPPSSIGKVVMLTITLDVDKGLVSFGLPADTLLSLRLLNGAMTEALTRELVRRANPGRITPRHG